MATEYCAGMQWSGGASGGSNSGGGRGMGVRVASSGTVQVPKQWGCCRKTMRRGSCELLFVVHCPRDCEAVLVSWVVDECDLHERPSVC